MLADQRYRQIHESMVTYLLNRAYDTPMFTEKEKEYIKSQRLARIATTSKDNLQPDVVPVGFDFDGAEFTHVDGRVTFEVLLASFGLDDDPALASIGHAVHFLDTGGIPVADAKGLETILRGIKKSAAGDTELAAQAERVFDSLYSAYAPSAR